MTFPEPFDATPNLTVTANTANSVYAEASDVTENGFTCTIRSTAAIGRYNPVANELTINADCKVWYQAIENNTVGYLSSTSTRGQTRL